MALTLDALKKLADGEGLRYFIAPDRPALMLGMAGMCGRYQFLMNLEADGQFLQFRTIEYLHCPANHPHLTAVLKVLGAINYQIRLLKFGWDPSDGEIVGYADVWLMDSALTQKQFNRMVQNYASAIDLNYARINKTLETGKDPGEEDAAKAAERIAASAAGLPEPVRKLLDALRGKGKKGLDDKGPEIREI